jgi:hypothetical protein
MGVLAGLWEVLQVSPPPEVEEDLRQEGKVRVTYMRTKEEEREKALLWVLVSTLKKRPYDKLDLSPPELPLEYFGFEASTGLVEMSTNHVLHVTGERAFFRGERGDLEEALNEAKVLRPVLSAMGLNDLESALEKLAELEDGEVRAEGPYVLARGGGVWALRRGTLLGDPRLDGAFLLGEEVVVSSGEMEVALKPKWQPWGRVGLEYVRFRFGEEEILLEGQEDVALTRGRDPIRWAIQGRLRRELAKLEQMKESPLGERAARMVALLKVLAQNEEPFWELARRGLWTLTTAELFLEM